ncbi:MAG: cation:proton antiporter [Pseudomonadota bacterium]
MSAEGIVFAIFLIFAGAAVLATAALFARQAMILAYIAVGALVGPAGFDLLPQPEIIRQIAEFGIMFLLYLLGLNLYPQKLMQMLGQATQLTLLSSAVFAGVGVGIALAFGLPLGEAFIVGCAMMFSSTILGLKLLPTTALHHRHAGEIIISVLLIQDVIAILMILLLTSSDSEGLGLLLAAVGLPLIVAAGWLGQRYVLQPLLRRFDQIQEYVFLLAISWCLSLATAAHALGLSYEIGAFVAGVSLAASPVSRFIADNLRPIRDFFLVIFFFTLGAGLDPAMVAQVALPALVLAGAMLVLKPIIFSRLLMSQGEKPELSREMGVRLGQVSEFSLLIAAVALTSAAVSPETGYLIQVTTLLSFIASSYWIVMRYPTPMAVSDKLRRD